MNAAHWHLMLNHLPIIGAFFGLILWIFALKQNLANVYRFALGWIVFTGISTIPVYWSGENGHELLHGLPDFSPELVEVHEAWGTYLLIALLATAALALMILLALKRSGGLPGKVWKLIISPALVAVIGVTLAIGLPLCPSCWTTCAGLLSKQNR